MWALRRRNRKLLSSLRATADLHNLRPTTPLEVAPDGFAGHETDGGDEEEEHVHLYKSKGQHILRSPRVLGSIVREAGVLPTDTVLEIGPGTGNLTLGLLRSASAVVAVEVDPRMVRILQRRAARSNFAERLTVIQEDVLKTQLPSFDLCVSNIPYNISSPLLAKLFLNTKEHRFRSATLLLQKEFARRLLAVPGNSDYCRLAANVRLVATVEHVMDVNKREFVPNPKVDSSLVTITPRVDIPHVDLEEWHAFTLICFGKKNKTLGAIFRQKKRMTDMFNAVKGTGWCSDSGMLKLLAGEGKNRMDSDAGMDLFKEKVIQILRLEGLEDKRPSKLSEGELLQLLSLFNQNGIYFCNSLQ